MGRTAAEHLWTFEGSLEPLLKKSKRCFHKEWLWHCCRVAETPKGYRQGWVTYPRKGFQSLGITFPPAPWAGLQAWMQMHTRAGCRQENPMRIKSDIWRAPQMGILMGSPNEDQASTFGSACSSKPSERGSTWDALLQRHLDAKEVVIHSQHNSYLFLPTYTLQGPTDTNVVAFTPLVITSSTSGVCACCIRGMGQRSVAAWKTLGISVLPKEAPQHPTWWAIGRTGSPKNDALGNVTSWGTTAIWECRYSRSILLSTHLRLHAVAGKIESTVSERVQKAHSYGKKDPAAPSAAAAPWCYLN